LSANQPYSEEELLFRLAEGDEKAMKQLFELYYPRLYYFAYKLIDDGIEAQDIAQEAVLNFWQRRKNFSTGTLKEAEAFMFTVARNRCYNFTRNKNTRSSKHAMLASTLVLSEDSLELGIMREDIFNRIYREIQQLAPAQVQLLKMIFIENLETAEIAERLEITPNNVRNQKARALEKLKAALLRKRLLIQILLFFC
jgi:RNA polymerase sigma factor (sigma-70 family)